MGAIMIGVAAFGLFMIYDVNTVIWKKKLLYQGFAVGCLCLVCVTAFLMVSAWKNLEELGMPAILCLAAGLFFLGALIYTLFFAIPFHDTYQEFKEEPNVCDTGVYGLCRHPGVLWFFFFYLFMGIGLQDIRLLTGGLLFSFCNLLYVILQDLWTFPKQFPDYDRYKKDVPFLIPTGKSIRRCADTMRQLQRGE